MVEIKDGVLYKDGISIVKAIEQDASLLPSDKKYEKKMLALQQNFWAKLMNCYIENIEDDEPAMVKLETVVSNIQSSPNVREELYSLLLSNPNIESIFKKAYYLFKSEIILGKNIKELDELHEVRDDALDLASEAAHVGEAGSAGIGFLSIFFSKKYRYMNDREVRQDIIKSIIVWAIVLLIFSTATYFLFKFLNN